MLGRQIEALSHLPSSVTELKRALQEAWIRLSPQLIHHLIARYLSTTEKMLHRRIQAHYEQLSEFERSRIIELKETDWANRRIAQDMGRSDMDIRRCWQKWVDSSRFRRHDGSSRSRTTGDREDKLIDRSAVTVTDS
ncbi:uncharacterized protein TNCV_1880631 [Trichonephila clavipes]|nr:uncharacterized protein TNCV_1880631 [Trichonephila clavipes]